MADDLEQDMLKIVKRMAEPVRPSGTTTVYMAGIIAGKPLPEDVRAAIRSDTRFRVVFADDPDFPHFDEG